MSGYYIVFNQLYLVIPLYLSIYQLGEFAIFSVFSLSALTTLFLQMKVTSLCLRYLKRHQSLGIGLILMGLPFLLLLSKNASLWMAILTTFIMILGNLICFPCAMALISELSNEKNKGLFYGFFYFVAGVVGAFTNWIIGKLWVTLPSLSILFIVLSSVACGILLFWHESQYNKQC